MKRMRLLSVFVACFGAAVAQTVSSDSTALGVLGSKGCQNSDDPPTLDDGSPATASFGYTYDRSTKRLTLVVENTTPAFVGVQNPLITDIFFNGPRVGLTGGTLVSQTGSGGAAPDFSFVFDADNVANPNPNSVGCFGAFSYRLKKNKSGIKGGISNAAATQPAGPSGQHVVGPVTFVIQFSGPAAANLTADAFSRALSYKSNGSTANAVAKFQGGAFGGSGFIGDFVDCSAGGFVVGDAKIGSTLQIVMTGQAGCYGCFVVSFDPGPAIFDGISMPVGFPWLALNSQTFFTPGTQYVQDVYIPNEPALVGLPVYGAVGLTDSATLSTFSVTAQIVMVITDC
jgi:hypothetical protein